MNSQQFEATATRDENALTICLSGEIDYAASLQIGASLHELVSESDGELLLDLDDVTFLDSEGLKMLLALFDQARRMNRKPQIVGLSERVRRVTDLAGVSDALGINDLQHNAGRRFRWNLSSLGLIGLGS